MAALTSNEHVFVVVVGYMSAIIGALGIVGNLLSLPVLWRRDGSQMSHTTRCFFVALLYHTLFLMISVAITSLHWIAHGKNQDALVFYEFTLPARAVGDQINWVLITASVYTILLLGIDRSVAIVKPIYWARAFTRKRIKIALVIIFVFSAIINAPTYFSEEYFKMYHPLYNRTFVLSRFTDFAATYFYQEVFLGAVAAYLFVAPALGLLICGFVIVVEAIVRRHRRQLLQQTQTVSPTSDASPKSVAGDLVTAEESTKTNQAKESTMETKVSVEVAPSSEGSGEKGKAMTSRDRKPEYGLGLNGVTTVILFVMIMTIVNRGIFGMYVYFTDDEDSLHPRFCSTLCAWLGALRHVLLVVNMSWTFLLFCLFDRKFQVSLMLMCCPYLIKRTETQTDLIGTKNKAFVEEPPKEMSTSPGFHWGVNQPELQNETKSQQTHVKKAANDPAVPNAEKNEEARDFSNFV